VAEHPDPADDVHGEHHAPASHDDHADEGHDGAAPGPIDVRAWAAAVGGIALGLFVVLALILSLS
jgi:hypothetical protein